MESRYHGLFDLLGSGLKLELELEVLIMRGGRQGEMN